jgi:hypothetical protein
LSRRSTTSVITEAARSRSVSTSSSVQALGWPSITQKEPIVSPSAIVSGVPR